MSRRVGPKAKQARAIQETRLRAFSGMFDFQYWCSWAQAEAAKPPSDNYILEFVLGKASPKPGASVAVRTPAILAELRFWVTGEADIDIMDLRKGGFVLHQWSLALDNDSFERTIRNLVQKVKVLEA